MEDLRRQQAEATVPVEYWDHDEFVRKAELLEIQTGFVPKAQAVMRCAECILSRPVFNEDTPSFTITEVGRCTGLDYQTIYSYTRRLIDRNLLEAEHAPTFTRGPTKVYRPRTREDGAQFFTPAPAPDCTRNAQTNLYEATGPMQLKVLGALSYFAKQGETSKSILQKMVREHAGLAADRVDSIFSMLCRVGMLEVVKPRTSKGQRKGMGPATYALTPRGLWIVGDIPPLEQQPPYQPAERQALTPNDLQPSLLERVKEVFAPELQPKILDMLIEHIEQGVLSGGLTRKPRPGLKNTGQPLQLSDLAQEQLGYKGHRAVAYYLGIEELLGWPRTRQSDMRRILAAPPNTDLGAFIRRQYYLPLRQHLDEISRTA